MSGGTIAAIAVGTVLAVGVVCLLLFWPQLLFAWLIKGRSQSRPPVSEEVVLEALPPRGPGRASGHDGSSNGADDAGLRPDIVHRRSIQPCGNQATIITSSRSPIIINNNIHINTDDYL